MTKPMNQRKDRTMKTVRRTSLLAAALACAFCMSAIAGEPGKLTRLPEKLPPSVEARIGKIELDLGLPTQGLNSGKSSPKPFFKGWPQP
jgi:hypothetical protein